MKKNFFMFISLLILAILIICFFSFCSKNMDTKDEKLSTERYTLIFNKENYLHTKLPILNNFDQELLGVHSVGKINQCYYKKEDSLFCYITINNVKYDFGEIGRAFEYGLERTKNRYDIIKTDIQLKNEVYKISISGGASFRTDIYFQIINNEPIILYNLENGSEIEDNNIIFSYTTVGTFPNASFYKWNEDFLEVCNLNEFLQAEVVNFYEESNTLSVIKKVDPSVNNNESIYFLNNFELTILK